MEDKIFLTQESYQDLLSHLVNFEEQMDSILDEYYPQLNQERLEVSGLLSKYNKKLEEVVTKIKTTEETDNTFPLVIVGSTVIIRDLSSQEIFSYSISGPCPNSFDYDDISYLSPVGRALLLKKVGDIISVKTPGGLFNYEIISIKFGNTKTEKEKAL